MHQTIRIHVNVWVEIAYNQEKNKVKTVYYSDAKSNFSMQWKDEDTLYNLNDEPKYPNSSIVLEIGKEIYHESCFACESWLMKDEYEKCYQYYRQKNAQCESERFTCHLLC